MTEHAKDNEDSNTHVEKLRASVSRFGQIHPVIEAADGDVISGEHRLKVNPQWRREKRDDIKDPFDKIAFKIAANVQRTVPDNEKVRLLQAAFLHYSRKHPNPLMTDFAKDVGVPISWVTTHIPEFFQKRHYNGILRIPDGAVLTSPIKRGEPRETTLAKVQMLTLKIGQNATHKFVTLPNVLTMKYDLQGGDELIINCSRADRFTIRKRVSRVHTNTRKP